MSQTTVDVATPRGTMPTYVHRPDGTGPSPRVLVYMDAPGIRPALLGYAERLAEAGYTAIVPDLYYPFDPAEKFDAERLAAGDKEEFARMRKLVGQIDDEQVLDDTRLILEAVPGADGRAWACIGFCMGGRPRDARGRGVRNRDRGGVAAPPHGSGHRRARLAASRGRSGRRGAVPRLRRERQVTPVSTIPPLRERLEQAGVAHRIEIFPGAEHGFTMPDRPAYDEAAAEQAWAGTLALLAERL